MTKINGIPTEFDLSKLHKCADLIYYDGPLLTHYATETGDHYLMYWVDADEECNRWLLARIELESLNGYLNKQYTLYQLLQGSIDSIIWVLDVDGNMQCRECLVTTANNLPTDYMPEKDALYEFETNSDYLNSMIDKYELEVPSKERSFFNTFISRMGLTINSRKIAVL